MRIFALAVLLVIAGCDKEAAAGCLFGSCGLSRGVQMQTYQTATYSAPACADGSCAIQVVAEPVSSTCSGNQQQVQMMHSTYGRQTVRLFRRPLFRGFRSRGCN